MKKITIEETDDKTIEEKRMLLAFYDSLSPDKRKKFMEFINVLNESMQKKKASK